MDWLVFAIVGGLVLAGALSALVFRTHAEWVWMRPRKTCVVCEVPRSGLDLIPFFGDAVMNYRCRSCRAHVAWQYPVIESAVVLLVVFHAWRYATGTWMPSIDAELTWLFAVRDITFSLFLLVLFVYDLKYQLIMDRFTLPAMVVALALNIGLGVSGYELVLAMATLVVFFLLQHVLSGGRLLGSGDVRMGLVMGSMLGFIPGVVAMLFAYVIGAIIGTVLLVMRRVTLHDRVPFGTFLAVASFVMLVWGHNIVEWLL
mgnify:FL=1